MWFNFDSKTVKDVVGKNFILSISADPPFALKLSKTGQVEPFSLSVSSFSSWSLYLLNYYFKSAVASAKICNAFCTVVELIFGWVHGWLCVWSYVPSCSVDWDEVSGRVWGLVASGDLFIT